MDGLKRISITLSIAITGIVLLIFWLLNLVEVAEIAKVAIILLSVSYIIFFFVLKKLVYDDLKEIENILLQSKSKRNERIIVGKNPFRLKIFQKLIKQVVKHLNRNQKKANELEKLAAFRKGFIADVSHELKTPIFAAQGFVYTLLDGAVEDKEVRMRFLEKAAQSLDSLDMLVHDLLTLSNIEIGETKMHFEYFALDGLVNEVIDQFSNKARKKNIAIEFNNSRGIAIVYADWLRIKQVLNNLISNAIKYTNNDGTITIELNQDKDNVLLEVKDNGVGIPQKDIHHIFERFYRVDKSRSREKGGTGLGLAIVKHILEGHGSAIEVNSVEGNGTSFMFSLPKGKE